MGAAVAVILMKERQIVETLERAGATAPSRARTVTELGVDTEGIGWRRLRDRAVVREAVPGSGLYYVDVEVWRAVRGTRHRMIFALLVLLVFGLALVVMGVHFGADLGSANR